VLHKEIPFLRICLPLFAGIISGLYIKPDNGLLLIFVIVTVSGLTTGIFINKYPTNIAFGFSLNSALFICGFLLYRNEKGSLSVLTPEQSVFCCTLSDYPAEKNNSRMLTVKLDCMITNKGSEVLKGGMIIYNKKDSFPAYLLPGDRMIIKCTPLEIKNRGNPFEFNYSFFMENHGIRYYALTDSRDISEYKMPSHRKLIYKALIIREKIINMYRELGVSENNLAIVAAITLGQKSMLDPEQKQEFSRAGVIHIMAVSGLHAMILSFFVLNILFFMKHRFNFVRVIAAILILWSFAFITGLASSVLRASLMFTFLQAGTLIKRRVNAINSVLASAFIIVLIKPTAIFDAGFLLSYSAVIFIIIFFRDLYLKLHFKRRIADKVWQLAVIAFVAQAGTIPITITLFNRFPTCFLLSNIIIVPLASLLIVTGCIIPAIFPVHFLSKFAGLWLNHLTGLIGLITAKTASLPFSSLENIGMLPVECILLTLTIFLFGYFFLKKRAISILYPLSSLLVLIITGTLIEIITRSTNELTVYNTPGSSEIGIRTGKILNLYTDSPETSPAVIKHCSMLGLRLISHSLNNKNYCLDVNGNKIFICTSASKEVIQNSKPEIVILTGTGPYKPIIFSTDWHPPTVIVTSKSSMNFGISVKSKNKATGSVHIIGESGAFIKGI
jgi:competence protein ComEC